VAVFIGFGIFRAALGAGGGGGGNGVVGTKFISGGFGTENLLLLTTETPNVSGRLQPWLSGEGILVDPKSWQLANSKDCEE